MFIEYWPVAESASENKRKNSCPQIYFLMFLFEQASMRENISRGGAQREEDTESKAGSRLWAVSTELDMGLKPTNCEIMTWAEVGHLTTEPPRRQKLPVFTELNLSPWTITDFGFPEHSPAPAEAPSLLQVINKNKVFAFFLRNSKFQ